MKILPAEISDAKELLDIQKQAYYSEAELHNDFEIPPLTQTLEELESEFKVKTILKVVIDGKIVASGQPHLKDGCCYIGRLAVRPDYQRQGIGSKLMRALESLYESAKRYELFTGEKSLSNLAMYKRRGYKQIKVEKLGKTNIIFMERSKR